ncbi:DUF2975 domain-containing protein [Dokdonia sinensis]|uniref:DUF2975 domain-containing protein n=1 Tax=Dokdonia sinensis TaxID=2479847 RepID=A0A3M0GGG0_9FLAO|nr:DUF2975 domain-containing protein [Dokdonia sinensis]RMB56406.1 DUF2975 domain-containing protein [Dokdonia sinensis]
MNPIKKTRTQNILQVMQAISWLTFISLLVQTGILAYSFLIQVQINPESASELYSGLDLFDTITKTPVVYYLITISIVVSFIFKTLLLYFVTQIFAKIKFERPFTPILSVIVSKMSYVSLTIGILSNVSLRLSQAFLDAENFSVMNEFIKGADAFILFAGILFIIAQVLKRGVEIQIENDLTI